MNLPRVRWKENTNAVELGFDFYLHLIERRLKGEDISLVQSLRKYYQEELGVQLRETQARGLMHKESSVFLDYARSISSADFEPGIQFWEKKGLEQFYRWRDAFYAARGQQAADIDLDEILEQLESKGQDVSGVPQRQEIMVNRIIRDSTLSRFLKSLYDYRCQVCSFSFKLPSGGRYAETHHLQPLGRNHSGIDKETNMLVLCPNHHAKMDYGVLAIHPDNMTLLAIDKADRDYNKPLLLRHPVERGFIAYHLSNVFNKVL